MDNYQIKLQDTPLKIAVVTKLEELLRDQYVEQYGISNGDGQGPAILTMQDGGAVAELLQNLRADLFPGAELVTATRTAIRPRNIKAPIIPPTTGYSGR